MAVVRPLNWTLFTALFGSVALADGVGPNVDELAKELANPGAANATLNFKFEYRTFDGDLPGADDEDSFTATFQPVFPFVLPNGNNLIFRPAIPYVVGQPVFDADDGEFRNKDAFGDLAFDLLNSTSSNGWTLGAGIVGSVPTNSNISSDNWLLGPSALAVKTEDWGVWGFSHSTTRKLAAAVRTCPSHRFSISCSTGSATAGRSEPARQSPMIGTLTAMTPGLCLLVFRLPKRRQSGSNL